MAGFHRCGITAVTETDFSYPDLSFRVMEVGLRESEDQDLVIPQEHFPKVAPTVARGRSHWASSGLGQESLSPALRVGIPSANTISLNTLNLSIVFATVELK